MTETHNKHIHETKHTPSKGEHPAEKVATSGKKHKKKFSNLAIALIVIGVLLILIAAYSAFRKSQEKQNEIRITLPTTTLPGKTAGSSSGTEEDTSQTTVINENKLTDQQIQWIETDLAKGYSFVVTDLNFELMRGQSKIIGVGFNNRLDKLRYYNVDVSYALTEYEDYKTLRESVDVTKWVEPVAQTMQVEPDEQIILPIKFRVPSDARRAIYHFYVNVCYSDPVTQVDNIIDAGCTKEYNKRLSTAQRVHVQVKE